MQIAVFRDGQEDPLIRVGGRWDMELRRYVGPAQSEVRIQLVESQWAAAESFFEWLRTHHVIRSAVAAGAGMDEAEQLALARGMELWYRVLLSGGRRAGKSWLACLISALYSLMIPGARIALVSPVQKKTDELLRTLRRDHLASEWREYRASDDKLVLLNGSELEFHTAHKQDLKLGELDMAVANEAQEQEKVLQDDLQGNTTDRGGLLIQTANPPRRARGEWVQIQHDETANGERPGTRQFHVDRRLNPHSSDRALEALAQGMTAQERAREIDGDMSTPVGRVVLSSFSDRNVIERVPITWRSRRVTREFVERVTGRSGVERIGAVDFDAIDTGCSFVAGDFYLPPRQDDIRDAILVIHAGQRFVGRHEDEFSADLSAATDRYDRPIFPSQRQSLLVADASSRWQSTESRGKDPEDRPSWKRLTQAGWQLIRPDADQRRNPRVANRLKLANDVLRPKPGRGPLVLFTLEAAEVIQSCQLWPTRRDSRIGMPDEDSIHAHLVDCWTYLVWRFWGAEFLANVAEREARKRLPETRQLRRSHDLG